MRTPLLQDYLSDFALGDFEATKTPAQSGLVQQQVGDLQLILAQLGWKATQVSVPPMADFGMYGPKTASAWSQSAT
jgi:hypothetical protein